jgi:hypothetical protein
MNGRCPLRVVYMSRQDCEVLKLSSFGAMRTTGPAGPSQSTCQDNYRSSLRIVGLTYHISHGASGLRMVVYS